MSRDGYLQRVRELLKFEGVKQENFFCGWSHESFKAWVKGKRMPPDIWEPRLLGGLRAFARNEAHFYAYTLAWAQDYCVRVAAELSDIAPDWRSLKPQWDTQPIVSHWPTFAQAPARPAVKVGVAIPEGLVLAAQGKSRKGFVFAWQVRRALLIEALIVKRWKHIHNETLLAPLWRLSA